MCVMCVVINGLLDELEKNVPLDKWRALALQALDDNELAMPIGEKTDPKELFELRELITKSDANVMANVLVFLAARWAYRLRLHPIKIQMMFGARIVQEYDQDDLDYQGQDRRKKQEASGDNSTTTEKPIEEKQKKTHEGKWIH